MLRAGRAYIGFALEHPGQYLVLFDPNTTAAIPPERAMTDPGVHSFELLVGAVLAGVETGEMSADLDIQATAVAIWGAVHGVAQILISKRGMEQITIPEDEVVIDTMLSIVLDGVRGRP
jgi:hypothetical protein